jgi:NADPH:quinone reductase-like Zn-dependent oxidoreductase
MIGGDYVSKGIRLLRPEGRMIFINAMKGNVIEMNIRDIMQKRLTITGSTLRNREASFKSALATEIEKFIWPVIESGKFKPVIYKTFALKDASAAHTLMESSEHIGKIVLEI